MKKLLKVEFLGSWTVHECTVHNWLAQIVRLGKKKKNQKTQPRIQRKTLNPNGHIETNNLMTLRNQIDPKIKDLNWVFAFFDRYFAWFAYCSLVTSSHIVDDGKCSWIVHVWHVASNFFFFFFWWETFGQLFVCHVTNLLSTRGYARTWLLGCPYIYNKKIE